MNIAKLAENTLERLGERKTMVFDGKEYTNLQLFDHSRRLHTAFKDLGTKRGSNIILCLMNNPLIYPVFEGIFRSLLSFRLVVPDAFLWVGESDVQLRIRKR